MFQGRLYRLERLRIWSSSGFRALGCTISGSEAMAQGPGMSGPGRGNIAELIQGFLCGVATEYSLSRGPSTLWALPR